MDPTKQNNLSTFETCSPEVKVSKSGKGAVEISPLFVSSDVKDTFLVSESEPAIGVHPKVVSDEENEEFTRSLPADNSSSNFIYYSARTMPTVNTEDVVFSAPAPGTPAAEALAANAMIKRGASMRDALRSKLSMKSLNVVKQINKRTKTKKGRKKKFSKNFKGKVIDGVHELYTLTMGMMLGLRVSVNRFRNDPNRKLTSEDFNYVEKRKFPPQGNPDAKYPTPPHPLAHRFKFKSYAPRVFQNLRDFFDINVNDYMNSVCGDCNYLEFISNSKSGQFFFYSHDGKYMIKTQTNDENKFLKKILPAYHQYVHDNPNTLLVRFYGMHRVTMQHLRRKVHFVIMGSVFNTPLQIHRIYDLKGSLVGREATDAEKQKGGVLKDMDLVRDKQKLHLGKKRETFLAQLEKDSQFLATLNIMDYSLLVGIHDRANRVAGQKLMSFTTPSGNVVVPHSNLPFRNHRLPADHEATGLKSSYAGSVSNSNPGTSRLQPVQEEPSRVLQTDASNERDSLGSIGTLTSVHTSSSLMNQTAKAHLEMESSWFGSGNKNQIKVTPPVARVSASEAIRRKSSADELDSEGEHSAGNRSSLGGGGDNRSSLGGDNRSSLGGDNRSSLGGDNRSSLGGDNRSSLGGDNRSSLTGNDSNSSVVLSGLYSFHLKNPDAAESAAPPTASGAASPASTMDKPRVMRKSSSKRNNTLHTGRSNESSNGLPAEIRDGSRVLHRKGSSRNARNANRTVSDDASQHSFASSIFATDLAQNSPPSPALAYTTPPTITPTNTYDNTPPVVAPGPATATASSASTVAVTAAGVTSSVAAATATGAIGPQQKAPEGDTHTFGLSAIANMWPRKGSRASAGSVGVQSVQTRSIQDADEDEIDEYYDSSSSDYEGSDDSDSDEYDEFSDPGDSDYSVASHNSPRGSFSTANRGMYSQSLNPGQTIRQASMNTSHTAASAPATTGRDSLTSPVPATRTRRLTDYLFGSPRTAAEAESRGSVTATAQVNSNDTTTRTTRSGTFSAFFSSGGTAATTAVSSSSAAETGGNGGKGGLISPRLSSFFGFSRPVNVANPATKSTAGPSTDVGSTVNPPPMPSPIPGNIHLDPSINSFSSSGLLDREGDSNMNLNSCLRPWTRRLDGGINSQHDGTRGDEIYFVGVIDILQQYNMNKRMETFLKSFVHDSHQISSVNSRFYAKRFVQFVRDNSD